MSWFPCLCGHRTDEHYLRGTSRNGPCKAGGCSCQAFKATDKPPRRD